MADMQTETQNGIEAKTRHIFLSFCILNSKFRDYFTNTISPVPEICYQVVKASGDGDKMRVSFNIHCIHHFSLRQLSNGFYCFSQ